MTPPTIAPTPSAAAISAHELEPPSESLATSGPSTWKTGVKIPFEIPAPVTTTQSQVREENSFQPWRSSATKDGSSSSGGGAACRRQRKAALTPKLAASTASAQPGVPRARRMPAIAGPATLPPQRERFKSAFASCSRAGATIPGTIAFEAGLKKAVAAPSIA